MAGGVWAPGQGEGRMGSLGAAGLWWGQWES